MFKFLDKYYSKYRILSFYGATKYTASVYHQHMWHGIGKEILNEKNDKYTLYRRHHWFLPDDCSNPYYETMLSYNEIYCMVNSIDHAEQIIKKHKDIVKYYS